MFDFRLFSVPTFTGAQITAFAISAAMFAQFLFIPLYLENVLGYSAVKTGVRLPAALARLVRRRADRRAAVDPRAGPTAARRRARDHRRCAAC